MRTPEDTFDVLVIEEESGFASLSQKPVSERDPAPVAPSGAVTARFDGFDLSNQPLISGVPGLPGEVVAARSTLPLRNEPVGSTLVVLFDQGNVRRPLIVGVLREQPPADTVRNADERTVSVQTDDDRIVLSADREIVLRCGKASITLTRAGKVLIHGAYVSTRSSGLNRITGGSVEIN
jgi:hypothetical protein